jgi:hypothetical protein
MGPLGDLEWEEEGDVVIELHFYCHGMVSPCTYLPE